LLVALIVAAAPEHGVRRGKERANRGENIRVGVRKGGLCRLQSG
jgi:hypothetical protein